MSEELNTHRAREWLVRRGLPADADTIESLRCLIQQAVNKAEAPPPCSCGGPLYGPVDGKMVRMHTLSCSALTEASVVIQTTAQLTEHAIEDCHDCPVEHHGTCLLTHKQIDRDTAELPPAWCPLRKGLVQLRLDTEDAT